MTHDIVYMIVRTNNGRPEIWYSPPGKSAMECWMKAIRWEMDQAKIDFSAGIAWKTQMRKDGWSARKVNLEVRP